MEIHVGDVAGGCLGHGVHVMVDLSIISELRRQVSRTAALDLERAGFGLFRSMFDRDSWEPVLKGSGVQEGWMFFQEEES